ncbi:MAG: SH3 domain-containing protein [Chloroflexota bacterium]
MRRHFLRYFVPLLMIAILVACNAQSDAPVIELPPTDTVQPVPSQTPRLTATIAPTNTPLPTFTPTATLTQIPPSPTQTFTPTLTPTVFGIVSAVNRINVRTGPDVTSDLLTSLAAGDGVQIIGQNSDGSWYNVRLDDGREGWMASRFIRVEPTPTTIPSLTPSPDLTALFLGTPLPATQISSGRATATPPTQVQAAGAEETEESTGRATVPPIETEGALAGVPTINSDTIFATATALAGGIATPTTVSDTADAQVVTSPTNDRAVTVEASDEDDADATPTLVGAGDDDEASDASATPRPSATPRGRTVRVFAFCDDPQFGDVTNVPVVLEGDTIEIWWGWIASTEDQVLDHIEQSNTELTVNGELVEDINSYVGDIQPFGPSFIAYWEVPFGPVESGEIVITYQVTWESAIYDGSNFFGPETSITFEQESCTVTVP